jgi:hypothetical protein
MFTNLKDKNILLFVPNGRGNYGTAIESELNSLGAKTWVFDERPSAGTASKIFLRMAKGALGPYFLRYLKRIAEEVEDIDFDYVITIRAEAFTPASVTFLRGKFKSAMFILYLWDSINNTNTSSILQFYDRVLSFDHYDCEKFRLIHRPLFFIRQYNEISKTAPSDIDVLFVAKLHSDRFKFAKSYEVALRDNGLSTFFFFYLQSKLMYYKMKLEGDNLDGARIADISFKPLTAHQVASLMKRSRASLDVQHPLQSGLTMRTLEVLGSKRKLITTNKEIKNYDFYNPENIMVVERNEVKVDKEFITSPFSEVSKEIYNKYSIQGWLEDIIGN